MKTFITIAIVLMSVNFVASVASGSPKVSKISKGPNGDPCTTLAKFNGKTYTPSLARPCFLNFPYDKARTNEIIDTMSNIHSNFYTFLDIAKEPPAKGFTFDPVDVLGGLEKIRNTQFKTDFDSNHAITQLINSLHDAHANYWSLCYTTIIWSQPLFLYAPIVNNTQTLKVFHVNSTSKLLNKLNLLDCDVLEIDGRPGMDVVIEYAKTQDQNSKDLGVRLNDALAGYTLFGSNEFFFWPGLFSRRRFLPENDSVTYTLKCANSKKVLKITAPWRGTPSASYDPNYSDSKSYWNANCANPAFTQKGSALNHTSASRKSIPKGTTRSPTKDGLVTEMFPFMDNVSAKLLFKGNFSRFYMLDNKTGVAMIATESVTLFLEGTWDYIDTITGFQKLAKAGAKKIIIDLVNNGGGLVNFGTFITALLFPDTIATFPLDLRASKLAQDLSRTAFAATGQNIGCSFWDSRGLVQWSLPPKPITTNTFIPGVGIMHGGTTSNYTQLMSTDVGWPFFPKKPFPWKSSDIAVFTNGACGSACTLIAAHIKLFNGVKTAAIGGFKDTLLTFVSFPGGFVAELDQFFEQWSQCGLSNTKGIPKPLPINAIFRVPVSEVYQNLTAKTPLEYIPLFADVHLDYTPQNARDPAAAWREVATALFK